MYKKITKIPDFLFALLTIILPISLIYAFFSPDFYGKTIISFWILLLITILNFFLCFLISFIWIRLKIVNFSFIFYYPIILFSFSILLVTYPLNSSKSLVILRVFLVFLSIFLIIPSLIIKKKIVQKAQLNLINTRTKKH
ncbi:hypothetical protein B5M19_01650 [Mesomycoplasma hyopneumoniae]|uniref:Uncharacterized protein n=3 Tax=Mesomycoplasma hyopneumoniae TaxID=2099 RepID=E4QTP6_MESH1|nr:hypothetical protein MHP168_742 [Mesomycoplasma hyopneumoniae 168]AGM22365.1 hypothetical protein MHP168L_742 [Mesomycoplasma hyopneumoniae 168-L]MCI8283617.1 hypothetical protein [Mesomycoplasma hyopneumoniae]MCI8298539.1 hypothetical protein [Mesomycoplasma hyopneumoniae]MCI8298707.1 hypothetical protein [Mesomycoplasma hyopneumoniae]